MLSRSVRGIGRGQSIGDCLLDPSRTTPETPPIPNLVKPARAYQYNVRAAPNAALRCFHSMPFKLPDSPSQPFRMQTQRRPAFQHIVVSLTKALSFFTKCCPSLSLDPCFTSFYLHITSPLSVRFTPCRQSLHNLVGGGRLASEAAGLACGVQVRHRLQAGRRSRAAFRHSGARTRADRRSRQRAAC